MEESPYTNILDAKKRTRLNSYKFTGVMVEKLKRKSILNCDLFKEVTSTNDSKAKTLYMTERIA